MQTFSRTKGDAQCARTLEVRFAHLSPSTLLPFMCSGALDQTSLGCSGAREDRTPAQSCAEELAQATPAEIPFSSTQFLKVQEASLLLQLATLDPCHVNVGWGWGERERINTFRGMEIWHCCYLKLSDSISF